MSNLMSTVYIAYVVEIIYKDGAPTLDMRVRVPSIHGAKVPSSQLPIAKPMVIPGSEFNAETLVSMMSKLNKVYVIFESGDYNKPVYFGVKGNGDLYDLPTQSVFIRSFETAGHFPATGSLAYLYRALDTGMLYMWSPSLLNYTAFVTSDVMGDTIVGTVAAFTTDGPISGLRTIDGVTLKVDDKVLVVGAIGIDDGIYLVKTGEWVKTIAVVDRQVMSIDYGLIYGGTMIKVMSGTWEIVKKSEQTKWSII